MDLKDFITTTLTQLMEGVAACQGHARQHSGYVNPTPQKLSEQGKHLGTTATGLPIFAVDFDVAVSATAKSQTEGGGKLQVLSIAALGGGVKSADEDTHTSRIRFSIPVALPVDADSLQERKERAAKAAERQSGRINYRPTGAV
jgi:hypothetical protein